MSIYTEDFGDIVSCARERALAIELLQAWHEKGLPDNFDGEGVKIAFNRNSGNVFLVNDDYQVAMLDDDGKLSEWFTSPYEGHEGFLADLIADCNDSWHEEDIAWLEQIKSL